MKRRKDRTCNIMAPVNEKKREAGKLKKHCLTLDEKIKILDANKKKKMSRRDIAVYISRLSLIS